MDLRSKYAPEVNTLILPVCPLDFRRSGKQDLPPRFAPFLLPAYTLLAARALMISLPVLRHELRPTIRLALPLVLAEIGWMSMGIVDTIMVGHLPDSARAIGSVSISSNLFNVLAFFGGGVLIGLDTLVAQAVGAGQRESCHRSLVHSLYLGVFMSPFFFVPCWYFEILVPSCLRVP